LGGDYLGRKDQITWHREKGRHPSRTGKAGQIVEEARFEYNDDLMDDTDTVIVSVPSGMVVECEQIAAVPMDHKFKIQWQDLDTLVRKVRNE
jgi:hypothetical protein